MSNPSEVRRSRNIRLYAHRGASAEAPENTMPSFVAALSIPGVDAIELDLHMTRDGHPVVSHDPGAGRMANHRVAWRDVDLAEARSFDMGWGFVAPDGSRPFADKGIRIPTFEEVLAEVPGVVLNVDIKQVRPSMVERVLRLVRERGAEDRVILASFHAIPLAAVRARRYRGPTALSRAELLGFLGLPRALLALAPLSETRAQVPVKAGPIHFARAKFVEKCHALGMGVDYWTVNDPAQASALLDLGADGIMTDDPRAIAPVFVARRRDQGQEHPPASVTQA